MTVDRDVRFSPEQLTATAAAVRTRRDDLGRKIDRAEGAARAGRTIQRGTLQRHYEELATLSQVLDNLEAARAALSRRLAALVLGGEASST